MRLLLAGLLMVWGSAAMAAPAVIAGDNVNVRRAAGRTAPILLQLDRGVPVEAGPVQNGWVKISLKQAYVHTDYLKNGKVAAQTNLRNGPGTHYEKVGTLTGVRACRELSRKGKWAQVCFDEPVMEGYVSESLLKYTNGPASADKPKDQPGSVAPPKDPAAPGKKADPPPPRNPEITADPGDEKWYGNIPVDLSSGRDVTETGRLYPMKQADMPGINYALLKQQGDRYVIACYVYTGSDTKYKAYANKQVTLVGDWYKVNGWKKPVMKLRKLRPRE